MKVLILFFFAAGLSSCRLQSSDQSDAPHSSLVRLVIIQDQSTSFRHRVSPIAAKLLQSLVGRITKSASCDVRCGFITADSHTEFLRYFSPAGSQSQPSAAPNPWLQQEPSDTAQDNPQQQWSDFASHLETASQRSASKGSDVAGALAHAVMIFHEQTGHGHVRNILVVVSDFQNTSERVMPALDSTIEVISIGALPDMPVERLLHTNRVVRFESTSSAFSYLSSTF